MFSSRILVNFASQTYKIQRYHHRWSLPIESNLCMSLCYVCPKCVMFNCLEVLTAHKDLCLVAALIFLIIFLTATSVWTASNLFLQKLFIFYLNTVACTLYCEWVHKALLRSVGPQWGASELHSKGVYLRPAHAYLPAMTSSRPPWHWCCTTEGREREGRRERMGERKI